MYLIPIQIPIFTDGDRTFLSTEWRRGLELLRDSFGGHFGEITVIAPYMSIDSGGSEQRVDEIRRERDGIRLVPVFDKKSKFKDWVLKHRATWVRRLRELTPDAKVVHAGLDDVYRPIAWTGFLEGVRANVPTVFVQDTDIVLQRRELAAALPKTAAGRFNYFRSSAYAARYETLCRRGVRLADLSLLKGTQLISHYGADARNPKEFHDTSYESADILPDADLERRIASISQDRPIRLVYAGRCIARKGIDHSLEILKRARDAGANLTFDFIGDGPELARMKELATRLDLGSSMTFHPPVAYDRTLLRRLAEYDGLLFTPLAEDTPRMIFDGYAAGLPLVAYDIEYVKERAREGTVFSLPRNDVARSAERLVALSRDPRQLVPLARAALKTAHYQAADVWYKRRAEWTIEAVARREVASPQLAAAV